MSQWVERRNVQLAALIAWVIAMIAAALLGASTALFDAVVCTGICVGLALQARSRRWWTATALAALGAQTVLHALTAADHSQLGRAVSAFQWPVILCLPIAVAIDNRSRHRA
jgi:hypothetical protein